MFCVHVSGRHMDPYSVCNCPGIGHMIMLYVLYLHAVVDNKHILNLNLKWGPIAFQGHTSNLKFTRGQKFADFDPNWGFPECNSSLNSLVALK